MFEAQPIKLPQTRPVSARRLLLFNLKTDADDDILGFTTDWINALAEYFSHIHVITMDMGRLAVSDNVTVKSVGKERGWSEPRRAAEFYRLLKQCLSESAIDACFAHMMPIFAAMSGPILRIKHIPITMWYSHKAVTPTLRLATFYSDRILTSTTAGFQVPTKKMRVIGHGIDTARFDPLSHKAGSNTVFDILHVGRISPIKRIEVLLHATALLNSQALDQRINLTLVGRPLTDVDRKYLRELESLVVSLGIERQVVFAGSVSFRDVPAVYAKADCMVNPIEAGALDKAVLEAMSCGLPVVTSNKSYAQVFGENLAGWVTESSDPVLIAERVKRLMRMSANERRMLGLRFRAIVERDHSLHNLVARIAWEIDQTVALRRRSDAQLGAHT